MLEWLNQSFGNGSAIAPEVLLLRLAFAFIGGCAVAGTYRFIRRREVVAATFPTTLILLSVLIAMVTQVIGDNVARAFSLVGALSIVRFRTVVEDTQDIVFVIFSVVVGMAIGAGHSNVGLIGTLVVGSAAVLVQPRGISNPWSKEDSKLNLRIGVGRDPAMLVGIFDKYLDRSDLLSVGTSRQGAALDLTYRVRLRSGCSASEMVDELNRLDGIQSVEVRRV